MQIRDNFPKIRSSYSETNHSYLVILIPQGIIRKCDHFSDYLAELIEIKITAKVTGQALEENKSLSLFFSMGTRKDLCSTLFCGEIRKFSCYTETEKGTRCFVQQETHHFREKILSMTR